MVKTRCSKGFTLIELLVVIAILAILIAILMPALSVVQDRADRTKCLGNTRQMSIAVMQLWDEDRDGLPYRSAAGEWGEAAEQLLPYLKNVKEVFDCPANPGNYEKSICKMPSYEFWTDYELNGYLCACPGYEYRRQNMITDYSEAAYAYDHPYDKNSSGNYDPDRDRAHKGGVNCAYLDGHAAWLSDEDMGELIWPDTDEDTFYHKGHMMWRLGPQ